MIRLIMGPNKQALVYTLKLTNPITVNIQGSLVRVLERWDKTILCSEGPFRLQFRTLKKKLEEGMVFTEYEQIPKKKANGIFSTATLPENAERSRIREVVPYEENRVELIPTKENNTGYINASHIKVSRAACREGVLTDGWVKGQNAGREKCRSGCPCASWLVPRPQGNGFELLGFSSSQRGGHGYHCGEKEALVASGKTRSTLAKACS